MSRETAFHPRLAALTDRWMDLFGYWAPEVVTDPLEEYRAVRETAGLMDFSMLGKVDLTGPGALDVVNAVVSRDVSGLRPGHIAYGAICDERGLMVDDCTVLVSSPDRVRVCGGNDADLGLLRAAAASAATGTGAGTEVEVEEVTDDLPHLCLQGPASRGILQPLANGDLSNAAFPYYTFREGMEIAGIPVLMTRMGYTAELGYELWVDAGRAIELWDALSEAGAQAGMLAIGMTALDLLRIEGGFVIGGVEYDSSVSPYECGLGWTVALDKPVLPGREALARAKAETVLRLSSVELEAGGAEASGATLLADGAEVGVVTQAVVSPYLEGRTLGLAKVHRDARSPGTEVEAVVGARRIAGRVVGHPVYDPKRARAKET